ncbi:hypothetical protein SEMRO_293_G109780.1 [Seminavis robusta]|uniref:Uncharacterized protein n=1 Tax=Seminavis robusta TaxID=568900 RepID=A0A9N8DR42_9STRA|nr:hypothetical protein SEMRO_293_G109780.1 [Seminavis robusta]|eukprot:Sro293_g109780.1 n/a (229) ;mRNA; f:7420-8150
MKPSVDASNGLKDKSKKLYIRVTESLTTIYSDFSDGIARLPPMAESNALHWKQNLEMHRLSIKPYIPEGLYGLCNFWYSTEAEKLFASRGFETAREAAATILALLKEAAKSTEHAKELITELAASDLPTYYIDNFDGEPLEMQFDPARVEKLAVTVKCKASYMQRAITLLMEADGEGEQMNWFRRGDLTITNPTTIQWWLRQFRDQRRFPNPLMKEKLGIALFVNHPQ